MSPTLFVYTVYVAIGAVSGLLSGLFGIGGGLVMVPALLAGFAAAGLPGDAIPPLALGTSLSAIGFASILASREHWRIGNLRRPFSRRTLGLAAFLALGVVAGAGVSTRMPRPAVVLAIGMFQIAVAAWMFRRTQRGPADVATAPTPATAAVAVPQHGLARGAGAFLFVTGGVSSIGGIGGATLMIPYFTRAGIEYPKAAALSTFFGCVVGLVGFVSYGLLAHPASAVPLSVGYVSVPAFASLALGSALLVRLGARLSTRIPKPVLARCFCLFLLVSGVKLMLTLAP